MITTQKMKQLRELLNEDKMQQVLEDFGPLLAICSAARERRLRDLEEDAILLAVAVGTVLAASKEDSVVRTSPVCRESVVNTVSVIIAGPHGGVDESTDRRQKVAAALKSFILPPLPRDEGDLSDLVEAVSQYAVWFVEFYGGLGPRYWGLAQELGSWYPSLDFHSFGFLQGPCYGHCVGLSLEDFKGSAYRENLRRCLDSLRRRGLNNDLCIYLKGFANENPDEDDPPGPYVDLRVTTAEFRPEGEGWVEATGLDEEAWQSACAEVLRRFQA